MKRFLPLAAAAVLLSTVSQAGALTRSKSESETSKTTIPQESEAPPIGENPALLEYARQNNVDLKVAADQLDLIGKLTSRADEIRRKDPQFSGFAIEKEGNEVFASLAKKGSADQPDESGLPIKTKHARLSESEARKLAIDSNQQAQSVFNNGLIGFTYDPMKDQFTAHYFEGRKASSEKSERADLVDAIAKVTDEEVVDPNEEVKRSESRPPALARGGQQAIRPTSYLWLFTVNTKCTTGFGVVLSGVGLYTTAAHCGPLNSVSGNPIFGSFGIVAGGYVDRQFLQANGASWLVYNGAYNEDMAAYPTHIYQGGYYCHYGSVSNAQRCGTIQRVNFPISGTAYGSPITVWTTEGSNYMTCQSGDSGGPVWQPRPYQESVPAGTIEGGSGIFDRLGTCNYLALDDQLVGSGVSLL